MKNKGLLRRALAVMLAVAMLASYAIPAGAVGTDDVLIPEVQKVDNSAVSAKLPLSTVEEQEEPALYSDDEMVRVSIVLESESTIEAGYATQDIAQNTEAMAYRADLQQEQVSVTAAIETQALGGEELDTVWNLTLAANIISANVAYGDIEAIEQVDGVKEVVLETRYEPQVVSVGGEYDPNMAVSSQMTGANVAWLAGYTGAGSRVAIIDTGLDYDHQSYDPDAFAYALAEDAAEAGMTYDEYVAEKDLLDLAEIQSVLTQLNAYERSSVSAENFYINQKTAFAYNYIDTDFDVTHDNDSASEHGSHVAGIANANRYIEKDGAYVDAASAVGVVGNAPDSQIIVMKVFGKGGGAYDSDYMVAIEDAIILGADSVNLSLGSAAAGMTTNSNATYQAILDSLTETDTVVVMSAGNNSYWASEAYPLGYLYGDDVNMHTGGSPGTYTNSLAVASVDNDGGVGAYFSVEDLEVVYTETSGYSNLPMATLDTSADQSGTAYEYVFVDGVGEASDYAGIDLTGKVVFCSRGTTSFYQKGDVAAELGAAAIVIYNNAAGTINMDLSDYSHTAPCVSITQAQGAAIRALSTEQTTADGLTYFTGTVMVYGGLAASWNNSAYLTMSSFSSWGVPGDLSMKPEITAPGGNIYSLNGAVSATDQYELMSGTSMAAPQVTGMVALVKQYIEENDLSQSGITDRALAQSLLMSTAKPMYSEEGVYYSVLQQGAGLANAAAATSATSYITVNGMPDGKVKVELGDDPAKTGTYSFSFTIHNMTDAAQGYNVYADVFTQDMFMYYANANMSMDELAYYMDILTTMMDATTTFTVNGVSVEPIRALPQYDFDADGDTDVDDAALLLEHAFNGAAIAEGTTPDVNGDGKVNTFDAHCLLALLQGGLVTAPANGDVTVNVTLSLTDEQKEYLDTYYTSGAYVEGFVYVTPVADSEGVLPTGHSIPVLGFYGNWTDPSMFEVGLYQEYQTGEEVRTPYLGNPTNTATVVYDDEPDTEYVFGGNPLVPDETYMPERNAINSEDELAGLSFAAIRNAAASHFTIENVTTGEMLAEAYPGAVTAAYYYSDYGMWMSTGYTLNVGFTPSMMAENDQGLLSFTLAPEYYVDGDTVDWDALGEGATLSVPFVVDNTAPTMDDVSINLTDNTLTLTAADNQYVAAVALFNKAGTKVYTYTGAKQDIAPGEAAEFELDLTNVNGKRFLLQVMDYAMNTVTYEINMQIGEPQPLPDMIAFNLSENYWTSFSQTTDYDELEEYAPSNLTFFAATIVDHMVLAMTDAGDLYVMPEDDLTDLTLVAQTGTVVTDMAYNAVDGEVYGVSGGDLVTIDKLTGEIDIVGEIGVLTNTLACDEDGTFYCNAYGTGEVYSFTLGTIDEPSLLTTVDVSTSYVQAMEINPNTGMLCWTSYYAVSFWGFLIGFSYYYEIDTATGEYTEYNDLWDELAALIIPVKTSGGSGWTDPVDEVYGIQISADQLTLLKGASEKLTATVQPWTATDRTVTWTSDDESVATVDANGVVTGVGAGTTTITATANLDPSYTATCEVTVELLEVTLDGVIQDEEGQLQTFTWDLENDNTWTGGTEFTGNIISAAKVSDTTAYATNSEGTAVVKLDLSTGDSSTAGAAPVPNADMSGSAFSTADQDLIEAVYYYYYLPGKDPTNITTSSFGFSSYLSSYTGGSEFVGVASDGMTEYTTSTGDVVDAQVVYLLDDAGYIWILRVYPVDGGSYSAGISFVPTTLLDAGYEMTYDDDLNPLSSLAVGEDGNLYFSGFNGDTNVIYRLAYDDVAETFVASVVGDVGQDVWPAVLFGASDNNAATNALDVPVRVEAETEPVDADEMMAAKREMIELVSIDAAAKVDNSRKTGNEGTASTPSVSSNTVFGGLNAIGTYEPTTGTQDIVIDTDAETVTVKIYAINSSNGLYDLNYDTSVLTLIGLERGSAARVNFVDGSVPGTISGAYADANSVTGLLATATFSYDSETLARQTTLTLVVYEDGADTTVKTETVPVTLPGDCDHSVTELVGYRAPTDAHPGYTGDLICSLCGTLLAKGEIIPAKAGSGDPYDDKFDEEPETPAVEEPEEPISELPFIDVDVDDDFYEDVKYVYENGIMNGISDTLFDPYGTLTRAMVVTTLYRVEGEPAVNFAGVFTDVEAGTWYANGVEWAAANGVVNGYGDGTFGPNDPVTREQLAAILYRYAALKGYEISGFADLSGYADSASVSAYATEAVQWAVSVGILEPVNGTLSATANATRAQVAHALHAFMVKVMQ